MRNGVFIPYLVIPIVVSLSLMVTLTQNSSNTLGFTVVTYPNGTALRFYKHVYDGNW